jgi:tetratricopeptide (TPR) repeat protein
LASAIWWLWYIRNNWSEARDWLVAALAAAPDSDTVVHAVAFGKTALMCFLLGDVERSLALEEKGVTLARALGDGWALYMALGSRVIRHMYQGRLDEAAAACEEAFAAQSEQGDWSIASSLAVLGAIRVRQGRLDEAIGVLRRSLDLSQAHEERLWAGYALSSLGLAEMSRGNFERADSCFAESVQVLQELGNVATLVLSLISRGHLAMQRGDTTGAIAAYGASLEMAWRVGRREVIASSLAGLASVAVVLNQPRRAAKLLAAAEVIREALGVSRRPPEALELEHQVTSLWASLGDGTFRAAWTEGRAMTLEQAVSYALGEEPDV